MSHIREPCFFKVCLADRNYQSEEYVLLFVDLMLFLSSVAFLLIVFLCCVICVLLQAYVDIFAKHIFSFVSNYDRY